MQLNSFTKIDNAFIDDIMQQITTHSELACCLVILRKTVGWGKTSERISTKEFQELTGIRNRKTIISAIKKLETKGLIKATKHNGKITLYRYKKAVPITGTGTNKYQYQKTTPVPVPITGTGLLYKEKKEKEREGNTLISEDLKQQFISHLMVDDSVKNKQGFEASIRRKLLREDKATLEMYTNWKESYEQAKAFDAFRQSNIGKQLEVQIKDEVLTGEITDISQDGDKFIVAICNENICRNIKFNSMERISELAA